MCFSYTSPGCVISTVSAFRKSLFSGSGFQKEYPISLAAALKQREKGEKRFRFH